MDIPKMPSNQQLQGREIALVKNEFKINLRDDEKVLTLWRVEINVSIFISVNLDSYLPVSFTNKNYSP